MAREARTSAERGGTAEASGAVDLRPPRGHARVVAGLWRAARAERLPHALLFAGPSGIGKFRAATWLAAGLLCAEGPPQQDAEASGDDVRGPCGACGPCKRVASGNHLDLFVIDVRQEIAKERSEELRIGRFVKRDAVRYWDGPTAEEFLSLRAAEGGWRVIVVREAERANEDTQNAILKMLEEPAERVLWILECSSPSSLLPTVRSRCVRIELEPLDERDVLAVLRENGAPDDDAAALARWSRGSPGDALRAWRQAADEMRSLLAGVIRGDLQPAAAASTLWKLEGEFEGRTAKAEERSRLRAVLDLALALVGDALRVRAGASDVAHADLVLAPRSFHAERHELDLARALDRLLELRRDVEANVDPPVLLDEALLALAPSPALRR